MNLSEIHQVLLNFEKRAENKPDEIIAETFVDAAPLIQVISAPLNQVIFGRRGTGKTHALRFCLANARSGGDPAAYIDIRSIGSNGSFYADVSVAPIERGLRLVSDILSALSDELLEIAVAKLPDAINPDQITLRVDDLASAVGAVKIVGPVAIETVERSQTSGNREISLGGGIDKAGVVAELGLSQARSQEKEFTERRVFNESFVATLDFGRVQVALAGLLEVLGVKRFWLLLDEWSETPREIQPYLADLIRKVLLPIRGLVIKVAAIEQRSSFIIDAPNQRYIGLELGADIAADLNLDEFLVFDYDEDRALSFFRDLLYKNYIALGGADTEIRDPGNLIANLFTEKRAFEEFVRAVEGVPRDALNLMSKAVMKAYGQKIGVDTIRRAALDWYQSDKINVLNGSPELQAALNHIIDEIIGQRKARAFLFPSNTRNMVIDRLYDARVLHLLKKNISSRDEPGRRYDAWKIDYGCYVDLIRTQNAPQGLLPVDDAGFVDIPHDDYRSIRRAVLTPEDIERFRGGVAG